MLHELLSTQCKQLVKAVGEDGFHMAVQMLSIKWMVACFVDYLPEGPLLLLWDALLDPAADEPGALLYWWPAALISSYEKQLLSTGGGLDSMEIVQQMLRAVAHLPNKKLSKMQKVQPPTHPAGPSRLSGVGPCRLSGVGGQAAEAIIGRSSVSATARSEAAGAAARIVCGRATAGCRQAASAARQQPLCLCSRRILTATN